jgi:uncharacterized paraquat-inducible protein A
VAQWFLAAGAGGVHCQCAGALAENPVHVAVAADRALAFALGTRQRTRLYRLLEVVGPWSMLDIYVVGLLVALVQLQSLATIKAGPGAVAFGAVVVLTMLSAMHFDPRLIWDVFEDDDERQASAANEKHDQRNRR